MMDHNLRIQPGESSANSPPSRRNVGKLSPLHPESTWSHHLKITSRNYNHSDLPPPQQKKVWLMYLNFSMRMVLGVGFALEVWLGWGWLGWGWFRLVESKFNASWVVLFVWAFVDLFSLSRTFVLELVSKYMTSQSDGWCFRIQPVDFFSCFIFGWEAGPLPDSSWKHP